MVRHEIWIERYGYWSVRQTGMKTCSRGKWVSFDQVVWC